MSISSITITNSHPYMEPSGYWPNVSIKILTVNMKNGAKDFISSEVK